MGHRAGASLTQDKYSGLKDTFHGDCYLLIIGFQLSDIFFHRKSALKDMMMIYSGQIIL